MSEKLSPAPESMNQRPLETELVDLSQRLYEGGKADPTKIGEYIKVAQEQGLLDHERLELTGSTMMNIYAAIAAEAGNPNSKVQEVAFNNPAREGNLTLYSREIAESAPEKPARSLMSEAPTSLIDPQAPKEVLDLRKTFAEEPEAGQQLANPQQAEQYMSQIIAQLRQLKAAGATTVRITGIPIWLATGGYFSGAREGMKRIISYTLASETLVYDLENPEQVGRAEQKQPQEVVVDLSQISINDIDAVRSGKQLQDLLGVEIARNKVDYQGLDLNKIKPEVALRLFDSTHSFSSSAQMEGVDIFQHLDPRSHDVVAKNKRDNPELLPAEQRTPVTIDIHQELEANGGNVKQTILNLAKKAVNYALELTVIGVTSSLETAIAAAVAHAAHGLLNKLTYKDERGEHLIKAWK